MRVVIVGGGVIGERVATELGRRQGNELVLIERDEARCEQLSAALDALVLHGDGTQPSILEKAGIRESHALLATTGLDPLNALIAILGRHFGVPHIVTRLDEPGLHAACQELGAMEIIAPRIAAVERILAMLYGTASLDLSLLTHGGLRMIELPAGSAVGKPLGALPLPDGALVTAVLRGERVLLARPGTAVAEGDVLLTLIEESVSLAKLRKSLGLEP